MKKKMSMAKILSTGIVGLGFLLQSCGQESAQDNTGSELAAITVVNNTGGLSSMDISYHELRWWPQSSSEPEAPSAKIIYQGNTSGNQDLMAPVGKFLFSLRAFDTDNNLLAQSIADSEVCDYVLFEVKPSPVVNVLNMDMCSELETDTENASATINSMIWQDTPLQIKAKKSTCAITFENGEFFTRSRDKQFCHLDRLQEFDHCTINTESVLDVIATPYGSRFGYQLIQVQLKEPCIGNSGIELHKVWIDSKEFDAL